MNGYYERTDLITSRAFVAGTRVLIDGKVEGIVVRTYQRTVVLRVGKRHVQVALRRVSVG